MKKECKFCGKIFIKGESVRVQFYCNKQCFEASKKIYQRKYHKNYAQRSDIKAKRREYYLNNPEKFNNYPSPPVLICKYCGLKFNAAYGSKYCSKECYKSYHKVNGKVSRHQYYLKRKRIGLLTGGGLKK